METIDEIIEEMRDGKVYNENGGLDVTLLADRIEAAVEAERKGWQQKIYGIDLMLQRAIDSLSDALNHCDYNEFKQGE